MNCCAVLEFEGKSYRLKEAIRKYLRADATEPHYAK